MMENTHTLVMTVYGQSFWITSPIFMKKFLYTLASMIGSGGIKHPAFQNALNCCQCYM